jgi:hypothetical protein
MYFLVSNSASIMKRTSQVITLLLLLSAYKTNAALCRNLVEVAYV